MTRTIHVRINDATTGRPTPARVRVTGPGGEAFLPLGRSPEFPVGRGESVGAAVRLAGGGRYFAADGSFEIALPAGVPLTIEATKGPEYAPLRHEVTLGPGQMALRLALTRWADWFARGWLVGDGRTHFVSPHDALLEASAEDVAVVNLLAGAFWLPSQDGQLYAATPNLLAFSGPRPALEADGRLVAVNTFNAHPVLGRLALLHGHRPVFPLAFGGGEPDDWTLADWCDQCHRKRGLVVWCDAGAADVGHLGEALAQAVLGRMDALEVRPPDRAGGTEPAALVEWRRLLAAGVRLPLVGSSGKESNRVPLGALRTYARLVDGEAPSYTAWVEAVRAGRTFVTNGPLVELEVDGAGPGATLDRPAGGVLRVRAEAACAVPFERLRVRYNGVTVAEATAGGEFPFTASLTAEVPVSAGGHLEATCVGRTATALTAGMPPLAQTSAVTVTVDGRSPAANPAAIAALLRSLEATRDWAMQVGRYETAGGRDALLRELDAARDRLMAGA